MAGGGGHHQADRPGAAVKKMWVKVQSPAACRAGVRVAFHHRHGKLDRDCGPGQLGDQGRVRGACSEA